MCIYQLAWFTIVTDMNIVLGSTSTRKKEILQKAFEGKFAYWGIEGVEARRVDLTWLAVVATTEFIGLTRS